MKVKRSPIIRCHTQGTVSPALSFVSNIYLLASMSKWSRRSISKRMVSILQNPSSACDSRYLNPTHGRSGGTKNSNVLRSPMVRTSQRKNEMIIEVWSVTQVGVRPPLLNCKIHNSIHQVGVKRLFLMSDSHYFSVSRTRLYNCASLMPLATGYLLGEVITTVRIAGSNQCLKNRLEQWKLGGSTKRQTMLDLDTLNPQLSISWPPPSANEEIKLRWDWLMVAFCANKFPLSFLQLACHEMQYARTDLWEYSDHFHQKSIPA